MKLGIKIKGEYLQLAQNTSIPLDIQSPLFFGDRDPDIIPGTIAYNFTIPITSHNKRLLNHPEHLDNAEPMISKEPCEIEFENDTIFTGILRVKSAPQSKVYTTTFIGAESGNLNDFKTRKLSTIDFEGERTMGTDNATVLAHANDTASNPQDYDYIFGPVKVDQDQSADVYMINNYYNNTFFRAGADANGFTRSALIPFVKATYILKRIFLDKGFFIENFMEQAGYEEFDNLVLFNNYSTDEIDTLSDPIEFDDLATSLNINLQNHVPDITINKAIKDIIQPFGGVLLIDQVGKVAKITNYQSILKKQNYVDWTDKVLNNPVKEEKYSDIPVGLNYTHTSSDGISGFYDIDISNNTVLDPVEKTTDLTSTDPLYHVRLVHSLNQYFYNGDSSSVVWRYLAKKLNPEAVGESYINLTADTVFMEYTPTSLLGSFPIHTPVFITKYISPINQGTSKINKTILMFYRGFDTQSNGQQYPFISNNVYNRSQVKIADYSLLCDGEYGLFNTWWKDWLFLINSAIPVTFYARLKKKDLVNFDFSRKLKIGDHQYFVKRIQTTLTTSEVKLSKLELIKFT